MTDDIDKMFEIAPSPKKRKHRKLEGKVQKACWTWLLQHQVFCWRNNTGSFAIEGGGYFKAGLIGSADIIGLLPTGRFLAVECKSQDGRQSESQKEFQEHIEQNKGLYILVRSVADLMIAFGKENKLGNYVGFEVI
jgi:hypothetical protein